jgi:hypothetical protein
MKRMTGEIDSRPESKGAADESLMLKNCFRLELEMLRIQTSGFSLVSGRV